MTDKEDTSSTKIIFFKGSESEWEDWSFGFLARAELGGYADILSGETKAPSKQTLESDATSTTVTDAVKDKNKKLYALNGKAWAHLVTSMKTDTCQVAINILKSCRTTEHPNGDAYKGFTALKDHYQIKSVVTVQRYLTEFFDKKMKIRDNPGEFITEMDNLRAKIKDLDDKNEIKDDFFKLRILNMLPKEYDTTVQLLEEQLQVDADKVTIAMIRERLITQFKRMEGKSSSSVPSKPTNPGAETMLYAGGFKGQCGKCGKYGHKRRDCPDRKKDVANVMTTPNPNGGNGNNNKQQRVICSYCKKPGHTRQQCFKLQRQNNGGGGTSHGNQSDKAEVVLTVVETYTRLCICYRCEDVANYGFFGRACRVCLVGEYREPLPDGHGIGRCPHCHGIDELEAECVQCSNERGEMCVFDSFDTDSVHLDLITNVETFPLLGTTLAPVHVDQSVIDRAASNDENAILAIEAAIRRHVGAHPGRIDNPRPMVIPQFFPSDEMLSVPDRNDGTYFELLLVFIATHAGDHRYQLRQFLLQVGIWLLPPGNELTSELSATAYRFVRSHVYDLVNIGILTVSHLVHSILDVNDRLNADGLRTFSQAELKMICRLAPVYLKAEFRWEERIDNPFPRRIVEQFPPAVRRKYIFEIQYHEFERQARDGDTVAASDDSESAPDTALVETSYFIASRATNDNLWVGDSGASCHMTCSLDGMYDLRAVSTPVQIGTGEIISCTQIGTKRVTVIQQDGTMSDIELRNCKYVPQLFTNLFSITKALEMGWTLSNDGPSLIVTKGKFMIKFDHVLRTDSGVITAVEMVPRLETAQVMLEPGMTMNINKFHLLMGHACESTLHATARCYGYQLTGTLQPCAECAEAKAKKVKVPKTTSVVSTRPGERFYVDISPIENISYGGNKYWLLVVDHFTGFTWSAFLNAKSQTGDRILRFLQMFQLTFPEPGVWTVIRCDNAGENRTMKDLIITNGIRVKFEFTPSDTPQYNGVVERKFQTLYNRVRTMLNTSTVPADIRKGIWAECAKHATDIENMIVKSNGSVSSWEQLYGTTPPMLSNQRQFGEVAMVVVANTHQKIRAKMAPRSHPCLYLGRALPEQHASSVLRFYDLKTKGVVQSRDITWLNKSYATFMALSPEQIVDSDTMELIDESAVPNVSLVPDVPPPVVPLLADDPVVAPVSPPVAPSTNDDAPSSRLVRELNRLGTTLSDVSVTEHRSLRSGRDDGIVLPDSPRNLDVGYIFSDFSLLVHDWFGAPALVNVDKLTPAEYKDHFYIPRTFDEAWNHPDPFQQKMWRQAIMKEFDKMKAYGVYKVIKRSDIPKGRRCVKHKWVFDIKRNGVFRARLVACGYSQQPGIDFTDTYSPVINDAVFRLLLLIQLLFKLTSVIIDVETAFLNGDLHEEIYMDAPKGSGLTPHEVWLLIKSLYGLVQSARQFFLKFREILLKLGFNQSNIEPCLFSKTDGNEVLFVALYVDDCYVVGHEQMIRQFIIDLKGAGLQLKIEEKPSDYLSCEIVFSRNGTKAWLGQPHLLKKLEKSFGQYIKKSYKLLTPGTPGYTVTRPNSEGEKISGEKQSIFRSGVGTLLQFVKHSRPDISNAVRELSKSMDSANERTFKEMLRVIQFVLATKDHGLYMNPKPLEKMDDAWDLVMYSDSDWATDTENRKSITGYILFVMGCPLIWKSKQQSNVTLSSTEAEYVALSEATKEIMFMVQTMESIGIPVNYPIIVKVDNVGAIFMSENITATARTRHIDARYHYIRDYVEDGIIKIQFVRTKENRADVYTKNTASVDFGSVNEYMMDRDQFEIREGVRSRNGT